MSDLNQSLNQTKDMLNIEDTDMQKLPQMLNVLTILTYIGCAIGAISAIWNYMSSATAYNLYKTMNENGTGNTGNAAVDNLMAGATDVMKKSYDNRNLILVFTLVGIALCFYGAMQMRNLKKQGFLFYAIGELLPVLTTAIFIGFGSLLGGGAAIIGVLFAAVFIALYFTQRKFLVN